MLLKLKAIAAMGMHYVRHVAGSLLHTVAATLRVLSNVLHNIGSAISPK